EFVVLRDADINAVAIGDDIPFEAAALLGCRFATSYRGLVDRVRLAAGEAVVVLGCGGVGLSAVLIATALGARVVAVDVSADALELARAAGAERTLDIAGHQDDAVGAALRDVTDGGADVVVEALGRAQTLAVGVRSLAS